MVWRSSKFPYRKQVMWDTDSDKEITFKHKTKCKGCGKKYSMESELPEHGNSVIRLIRNKNGIELWFLCGETSYCEVDTYFRNNPDDRFPLVPGSQDEQRLDFVYQDLRRKKDDK